MMRGLLRAAVLLAPALATAHLDQPEQSQPDDALPAAVIRFDSPELKSDPAVDISLRFDILESRASCGYGNVTLDGQTLDQDDHGVGSGSISTRSGNTIIASWNLACVPVDNEYQEQVVDFKVHFVDGKEVSDVGFTVQFQQTAPPSVSYAIGTGATVDIPQWAPPPHEGMDDELDFGPDAEIAELEFLKMQLAELQELVFMKEQRLAESFGYHKEPLRVTDCDNLKCIIVSMYRGVKGFAHHIYGHGMGGEGFFDGPGDRPHRGHHGDEHKHPGHRPPFFPPPPPHHFNHTHGNHTHGNHTQPPFPHPPFHPPHGPPPHFRPPFCHCPPPPFHHGPPPPHAPWQEPPRGPFGGRRPDDDYHHGPNKEPYPGSSHEGPAGGSAHPPHRSGPGEHEGDMPSAPPPPGGDRHMPPPPPPFDDDMPPPRFEGDRPPPPPSSEMDRPQPSFKDEAGEQPIHRTMEGGHGERRPVHGPSDHGPGPHDQPGPQDGPPHGHHPPPPGFFWRRLFHPVNIFRMGATLIVFGFLLAALHTRCFTTTRADRRARREAHYQKFHGRRAAKREALKNGVLGVVQRLRVSITGRDPNAAEKVSMVRRNHDESDDDNESTTMEQEIVHFRTAADVVSDMVAAEEGRARTEAREIMQRTAAPPVPPSPHATFPDYTSADELPAYDDGSSESYVADGMGGYTPGSSSYTPSDSTASGSLDDVLGRKN